MSSFQEFVSTGWREHADQPEKVARDVAARLEDGVASDQREAFCRLLVHVYGEHLGRWDDGLALLERLLKAAGSETASASTAALWRSVATLAQARGDQARAAQAIERAAALDASAPAASHRARVLATAAGALAGQLRTSEATAAFQQAIAACGQAGVAPFPGATGSTPVALQQAPAGAADPAARALAVAGNNLAATLEMRESRSSEETALMLLAADAARHYWAIAGAWLEIERAEYRLAMSRHAAGEHARAIEHAKACLAICVAQSADAGERFFAYEAMALAHAGAGDGGAARSARDQAAALIAELDADLKGDCEAQLIKLTAQLAKP